MTRVEFISHSGASEVGANAFELRLGPHRFLLDCGAISKDSPRFIDAVSDVDAVWLSHAHWDHMGSFSHLVAKSPRIPVLATGETARLLPFALKAAWGNDPRGHSRGLALSRRVQVVDPGQYHSIHSDPTGGTKVPDIRLLTFGAGHILGAAMVLVSWQPPGQKPFRVLYTGDYCAHDQLAVEGALIPRVGPDFAIDVVISEGILGTDVEADELDYDVVANRLVRDLQATEGPRLVAVAPLGEALETLLLMTQAGLRPFIHDWLQPLYPVWREQFPTELAAVENRFVDTKKARLLLRGGQIVVAAGEQLQLGSTAGQLATEIAHLDDALIAVFNRISPNSPAAALLRASHNDELNLKGRRFILRAATHHYRLLNHAPRWQILATINALNPRQVVFVHGKKGTLHALRHALSATGYTGAIAVPVNREVVPLD